MSKMKEALKRDVMDRFGEGAAKCIEYLFENGVLDDGLARRHIVKVEVFKRMMNTRTDEKQIHSDVGEDVGLGMTGVYKICRSAGSY